MRAGARKGLEIIPTSVGDDAVVVDVVQQKGRARHGQLAVPRRAADERPREGRLSRSHVAVEQEDVPWFSPGGEQRGEARRAPLARGDKGEGGSFQIAAAAAASVFSLRVSPPL